jgi:hypothetical protein
MVVALDNNSSFTRWVSLNSCIACSFSRLSSVVCNISNACLRMVSNAERHIWYCSGRCSVTYSLIVPLACSRRYCTSELIEALETCSSKAISAFCAQKFRFLPRKYYAGQIFSFIYSRSTVSHFVISSYFYCSY